MLADRGALSARRRVRPRGRGRDPRHPRDAPRLDRRAPGRAATRGPRAGAGRVGRRHDLHGGGPAAVAGVDESRSRRDFASSSGGSSSNWRSTRARRSEVQYSFLQASIKEVAYSTLSKPDRRSRHLATAHHLESLNDDEPPASSPPTTSRRTARRRRDRGRCAGGARPRLALQAAERALSLGSPEQAIGYADIALDVTPKGPERAALLTTAASAASLAAWFERAEALCEEAIALHEELRHAAAGRATPTSTRSSAHRAAGPEAVERMERALEALGDADEDVAARALCAARPGFQRGSCGGGRDPAGRARTDDRRAAPPHRRDDEALDVKGAWTTSAATGRRRSSDAARWSWPTRSAASATGAGRSWRRGRELGGRSGRSAPRHPRERRDGPAGRGIVPADARADQRSGGGHRAGQLGRGRGGAPPPRGA